MKIVYMIEHNNNTGQHMLFEPIIIITEPYNVYIKINTTL